MKNKILIGLLLLTLSLITGCSEKPAKKDEKEIEAQIMKPDNEIPVVLSIGAKDDITNQYIEFVANFESIDEDKFNFVMEELDYEFEEDSNIYIDLVSEETKFSKWREKQITEIVNDEYYVLSLDEAYFQSLDHLKINGSIVTFDIMIDGKTGIRTIILNEYSKSGELQNTEVVKFVDDEYNVENTTVEDGQGLFGTYAIETYTLIDKTFLNLRTILENL